MSKIFFKELQKEDEMIVEALHLPIIDEQIYFKVQRRFKGIQKQPIHKSSQIDEELPLRGFLECKNCRRSITGSSSKGRNGVRHFYYHCQPKCKERYKAHEVNELFEDLLKDFHIKEDVKKRYKEILNKEFKGDRDNREDRLKEIKKEINTLEIRKDSIEEKFFDNIIDLSTYKNMKTKTQEMLNDLNEEFENLKKLEKDIDKYLKLGISFLHGIDKLYISSPANIKKKIVGSIFPEKLVFLKTKYRTASLNELIAIIVSKHKGFRNLEIKKPRQNGEVSKKAPPLGLEPRTL